MEHWFRQKALEVRGNQLNVGKTAMFSKGYIGQAYTDIITTWFGTTHKFHFTSCGSSLLAIDLPSKDQVNYVVSNADVTFDIEIVCDRNMNNTIRVRSGNGVSLYDNDGNYLAHLDMARGDVLSLRYYNGGYMVLQYKN